MQGRRITRLIQMGSIGISDTTPVASPWLLRKWRIVGASSHSVVVVHSCRSDLKRLTRNPAARISIHINPWAVTEKQQLSPNQISNVQARAIDRPDIWSDAD
jgi:hypothetical protein